jgi:hypothetical protein
MAGKSDVQAGRAFVSLFLKDDMTKALAKALGGAGESMRSFGAGAMKAGAAVSAAGAAVLAPLVASVKAYVDMGGAAIDAAARTGLSVEALSELSFAAQQTGASLADVETAMKKAAKGGLAKAGETAEQTFTRLAAEVAAIEDPMMRAAKAQEYFGRSGTNLLPMLGDLESLRAKARELGIVMSTEDAAAADDLGDAIDQVKSQVAALAFQVGAAVAKPLMTFAKRVQELVPLAIGWVKANQQAIVSVGKIGLAIVAAGGLLTAFGAVVWGLGSVLTAAGVIIGTVGSALALLTSPIGLVTAALVAGAVWWTQYTEDGQRAVETLTGVFGPFAATITKTIQGIISAITQGKWSEAGALAGMGLKLAFQDAIEGLFGDSQIKNAIYKLAELFGGGRWAEIGTLAWQGLSESLTIGMETIKANWDIWLQGLSDKLYEQMGKVWEWWNQKIQAMTTTLLEKAGLVTPAGEMQGENDRQRGEEIIALRKKISDSQKEFAANRKYIDEGGTAGWSTEGFAKRAEAIENMRLRLKGLELVERERQKNMNTAPQGLDLPEPGRPTADTSVADRERARETANANAEAAKQRLREMFGMDNTPAEQAGIDAGRSAEREKMRKDWEARLAALAESGAAPAAVAAAAAPGAAPGAAPIPGLTAPASAVAMGPTYSAAAAQAMGQTAGGPQEKMAANIYEMKNAVVELGLLTREQAQNSKEAVAMYQRFLAAFQYG